MGKYDAETFLDNIKTFLSDNLTSKLSSIDTEKADSITLDTFDANAYYFQDIPDDNNYSPWLIYGLTDPISTETFGASIKQELTAEIAIGHDGIMNSDLDTIFRYFNRYTRAVMEILAEKFAGIGGYGQLKIEQFPLPSIEAESGELVRLPGVRVTATIAT